MQRLAVHRPRHLLSHRPGFRSLQGRALGRRHEDGAGGSRRERGDVLARYRDRLSRRRVHHRRLRAWRERREGHGRSGRVLRPQADLPARPPGGPAPGSGQEAGEDDLRAGPHPRAGHQPADPEGRPGAVLHQRRGGAEARRLHDSHRGSLQRQGRYLATDGHRMGKRWPRWRALHRPGAAGDGRLAASRSHARDVHAARKGRGARQRPRGRHQDRDGTGARDPRRA